MIWPHAFDHNPLNLAQDMNSIFNSTQYIDFKSKTDYLRNKFISAKNEHTLYFIRCLPNILQPDHLRTQPPDFNTAVKIRDAINNIRQQNRDYILLVVIPNSPFIVHENIIICSTQDPPGCDFIALSPSMQTILSTFRFV